MPVPIYLEISGLRSSAKSSFHSPRTRRNSSAQPLDEQLVELVRCLQRDPVAGAVNLLVTPRSFHEAIRHLHAFTVEVVIVRGPDAECGSFHGRNARAPFRRSYFSNHLKHSRSKYKCLFDASFCSSTRGDRCLD